MNSDHARPSSSDPDESVPESKEPKPAKKFDLSLTQVIGGSLAAATAAALGSQLGVAGTIIGAAVISVISAVAASLYTTSLRHTRAAAKAAVEVVRVKRLDGQRPTDIALDSLPTAIVGKVRRRGADGRVIERQAGAASSTAELATQIPDSRGTSNRQPHRDDVTAHDSGVSPNEPDQIEELLVDVPEDKLRRLRLRPILIGAGAIFVVALVGITGYELASGESISGGNRTSLQQVVEGKTTPPSTPAQPSDTHNQTPSTSTTAPQDGTSTSPSVGQSASPSDSTTPSTPSTSTPPTSTESTPPTTTTTPNQPAAPTGNSKPEAGATTPASPTDAAPPATSTK
ncbi:hypothetical protein CLV47_10494 [Antricoccus suffuscus]|uniref:Uncharacterized protein n=1 Tax=Antricoccus suffuscus TaxID=1629062 RepID=A0A2T1A344_9ACTN|nr:hypothetical protein [Antricoccus suffuscus]PRZ42748.1 hypothetical protein CLV47_10494 [Antricoccus suffuscus]